MFSGLLKTSRLRFSKDVIIAAEKRGAKVVLSRAGRVLCKERTNLFRKHAAE